MTISKTTCAGGGRTREYTFSTTMICCPLPTDSMCLPSMPYAIGETVITTRRQSNGSLIFLPSESLEALGGRCGSRVGRLPAPSEGDEYIVRARARDRSRIAQTTARVLFLPAREGGAARPAREGDPPRLPHRFRCRLALATTGLERRRHDRQRCLAWPARTALHDRRCGRWCRGGRLDGGDRELRGLSIDDATGTPRP